MTYRTSTYYKAQEFAAAQHSEAALVAFEQAAKEEPDNFEPVVGWA